MSSARDKLASRLEFRPPGAQPAESKPAPDTQPRARTKLVRRTVDLPVARHHALTSWCEEQAVSLGVARVPGQYVMDELVHLLLTDERTAKMIREALRKRFDEE